METIEHLLVVAAMLVAAKLGGWIFAKLKQPVVLGQLLAGILLGIWLETSVVTGVFSSLGVHLLLFLAGLESNLEDFRKVGGPSILIGVLGVVCSFVLGFLVSIKFVSFEKALLFGALATPTSVSITVRVLMEIKQIRSREGTAILASAVADDILGIVILTVVISMIKEGRVHILGVLKTVATVVGFIFVLIAFGIPLAERLFRLLRKVRLPESTVSFAISLIIFAIFVAEKLNLSSILGAYMMGLVLGQTSFRKLLTDKIVTIGYAVFIPLFFVEVGMGIKLHYLAEAGIFAILYSLSAVVGKVVGCGVGALLGGFSPRESVRVGIGMIPRMGVELAMLVTAIKSGVATPDMLSVAMVMIFLTTIITPPLLKVSYSSPRR